MVTTSIPTPSSGVGGGETHPEFRTAELQPEQEGGPRSEQELVQENDDGHTSTTSITAEVLPERSVVLPEENRATSVNSSGFNFAQRTTILPKNDLSIAMTDTTEEIQSAGGKNLVPSEKGADTPIVDGNTVAFNETNEAAASLTVNTLMDLLFLNDEVEENKASYTCSNSRGSSRSSSSHHLYQHGAIAAEATTMSSLKSTVSNENVGPTNFVTRNTSGGSSVGSNTSFTLDGTQLCATAVTHTSTGATITRTSTLLTPVRYRSTSATTVLNRRTSNNTVLPLQPPMFVESETRVWDRSTNAPHSANRELAQSSPAPLHTSYSAIHNDAPLPVPLLSRNSTALPGADENEHHETPENGRNPHTTPSIPQLPSPNSNATSSSNDGTSTVLVSAYLVEPTPQGQSGTTRTDTTSTTTTSTPATSASFATPLVAQHVSPVRSKSFTQRIAGMGMVNWWRYFRRRSILLALAGTVILVFVVVATSLFLHDSHQRHGPPKPPLPLVITSTLELYEAVDAYLQQSSSDGNTASSFFAPIGTWDVSRVTNFSRVFDPDRTRDFLTMSNEDEESGSGGTSAPLSWFDEDISAWNVSSGMTFYGMFAYASNFNGDVSGWDLSLATEMSYMFSGAARFNGDVSRWNVGGVTTMDSMFYDAATFEADLSAWDVSNVLSMSGMFDGALLFNSDVSGWNVSAVQDLSYTFRQARTFQGDLSEWDVSRVTLMAGTFQFATVFAGNLSAWNVSRVTTMHEMFADAASFASDVSGWDVRMYRMRP
jgi:surface protein